MLKVGSRGGRVRAGFWLVGVILVLGRLGGGSALGRQEALRDSKVVLIEALAREPMTAPFFFEIRDSRGRLHLEGRVGSRVVHDAAIQLAFGLGVPVVDDLIIDTAAPRRVVAVTGAAAVPTTPLAAFPSASASTLYPFPAPLFGPPIDPFLGYEPPLITYPPWWRALSAQRTRQAVAEGLALGGGGAVAADPEEASVPRGSVAMNLDPLGYARLTGKVPSEEARAGIVAKVARMEGVAGVIDRMVVDPAVGGPEAGVSPAPAPDRPAVVPPPPAPGRVDGGGHEGLNSPPPRPVPFDQQVKPTGAGAGTLAPGVGAASAPVLAGRVRTAIESDPTLVGAGVGVTAAGDTVTLSGEVPGVYEAMRAYLAARATPGVGHVIDALRFTPPQAGRENPLIERGEPTEVAAYLEAQIERQSGGGINSARVEVEGSRVDVWGEVGTESERRRVEAILRSMPILRGFTQRVQITVR